MAIIVDPYSGETYTVPDVTPTAEELRKITVPSLTALYNGISSIVTPTTPSLTGGSNVGTLVPQIVPTPIVQPQVVDQGNKINPAIQKIADIDNFMRDIPLFGWLYNASTTSFGLNKNATPQSQGITPKPLFGSSFENFQFLGYTGVTAIMILLLLTGGLK